MSITTTFSPAPKPAPRAPKPKQRIPRVSAKVLAANGGKPPRKERKAIKPKKRTAKEDRRIYGSPEFRAWLHAQPCMICLADSRYTEQAHAKGEGMGRKASWRFTFPACGPRPLKDVARLTEGCHRTIHRVGVQTYERALGFTLLSLAEETQRRWDALGSARGDEGPNHGR